MYVQDLNKINSKSEKLLDITIDSNLSFQSQVNNLCKKASSKIHALARVALYMNIRQRRMIVDAFFNSQFGYCPLIWMFYGRMTNNKINKLHERCLRTIFFFWKKIVLFLLHHINLRILVTEMFKVKGIFPETMK